MKKSKKFSKGDFAVYPAHGVGRIIAIESEKIGNTTFECLVIDFDRERLKARVPLHKVDEVGLRKLSSPDMLERAFKTLTVQRRVSRVMWSRRAQEYEAKIHSGDPISLAEVICELHRQEGCAEQAYSERQIYQEALDRLGREIAAIEKIGQDEALTRIQSFLAA